MAGQLLLQLKISNRKTRVPRVQEMIANGLGVQLSLPKSNRKTWVQQGRKETIASLTSREIPHRLPTR